MCIKRCLNLFRLVAISFIASITPILALAQSIVLDAPVSSPISDAFSVGKTLTRSNSLEFGTLKDLTRKVAGRPSIKAFSKFNGNFEAYWNASNSQWTGKIFEALVIFDENRRLASLGNPTRLLSTGAEGNLSHAADIVRIDANRVVQQQFQLKLGWKAARDALSEPKYAGMTVVAPPDSLEILRRELAKAEDKAIRRGFPHPAVWGGVKRALEEGRITDRLPSGEFAPTRDEVSRTAKRHVSEDWASLGSKGRTSQTSGNVSRPKSRSLKVLGKAAGHAFVVFDLADTGCKTYSDIMRLQSGEIGAADFASRSTIRTAQLGLTLYSIYAPDPTLVTKVVTAAAVVLLVAADEISDRIYQARIDEARRLLEWIDKEERYYSARKQLIELR